MKTNRNGESTFKIFAPMLKASRDSDGKMRLHGIASSTVRDKHGDTMSLSALSDMERSASNNLTIFLNHEYKVPEDVAGSVERAMIRSHPQDTDVHDLVLDIVMNESNPRAVNAWEAIQNGTQLGLSIGAMIPEGGATRDRKSGSYQIDHVELLETSLVGVPANPRSWVEYAVKSLNGAPVMEPEEEVEDVIELDEVAETLPEVEAEATFEEEATEESDEFATKDAVNSVVSGDTITTNSSNNDHIILTTTADPSITNATVNIKTPYADVSIDTGNRGGSKPATEDPSQATLSSEPETEEEDEEKPNPWAAIGLSGEDLVDEDITSALRLMEPTVVASLRSSSEVLKAVTRELIETKAALAKRDEDYEAVVKMAEKVVTNTAEILEKLSTTPVGRRALVREANEKFASLKSVYSDDFLALLKRS